MTTLITAWYNANKDKLEVVKEIKTNGKLKEWRICYLSALWTRGLQRSNYMPFLYRFDIMMAWLEGEINENGESIKNKSK